MYDEAKVQQLKVDLESAVEDVKYENEDLEDDCAFDLSVSLAAMADHEDAVEFLRREWGYVPASYYGVTGRR